MKLQVWYIVEIYHSGRKSLILWEKMNQTDCLTADHMTLSYCQSYWKVNKTIETNGTYKAGKAWKQLVGKFAQHDQVYAMQRHTVSHKDRSYIDS